MNTLGNAELNISLSANMYTKARREAMYPHNENSNSTVESSVGSFSLLGLLVRQPFWLASFLMYPDVDRMPFVYHRVKTFFYAVFGNRWIT